MKTIDFYYDFGSPTAYIAHHILPKVAEAAKAEINWKPVLLGGIFQATGNATPAAIPAKGNYYMTDMARTCRKYDLPFAFNPHFPINTLPFMRAATAFLGTDEFAAFKQAIFKAMWVNQKNLNDIPTAGAVLAEAGFDPQATMAKTQDQAVKDALKATTEEAIKRGAFGVPTFYLGDEMFFGQDRVYLVAEQLGINFLDVFPKYIEA